MRRVAVAANLGEAYGLAQRLFESILSMTYCFDRL
jgi:hypothetical protein